MSAYVFATPPVKSAVITARPKNPTGTCTSGLQPLGLGEDRDGMLYVPSAVNPRKRLPLVVFLHGATGDAHEGIDALREQAERRGFLLLAPESRGRTWDAIRGSFGPDVEFLNRALERVFAFCAVDAHHITLAGFSDGASYALSLGLANGDLFSRIIALSAGLIEYAGQRGSPAIFVAHGTRDGIIPVGNGRHIVDQLQAAGYFVRYREFDGRHAMSRAVIDEALRWAK